MKDFKKLIKKLENLGEEIEFNGENSVENIALVERELDIQLDEEIKAYLLEFGGGGISDILYTNGILPEEPLSENIYTIFGATKLARETYHLPKKFVVLDADLPEKCWVLECFNTEANSIYGYNCISQKIENKIYNSFHEYLFTEWEEFIDDN